MAVAISACLLGRFRRFFADLFFDFASPFARKPGAQKAVKQIRQEQHGRHPFVIHHRENENKDDDKKTRNRFLRLPINRLEAGILKPAEHHEGKKEQQRRQNEAPFTEVMLTFREPKKKQRDRCNQTGGGGNGKTSKRVLVIGSVRFGAAELKRANRSAPQAR